MTLAGQLDKPKQGAGELGIVHVLLASGAVGPDPEAFGLGVPLEGVQVEDAATAHKASDRSEEAHVLFLLEMVQHAPLYVDVATPEYRYAQLERLHDHLARDALARGYVQQDHLRDASVCQPGLVEQQLLLLDFLFLREGLQQDVKIVYIKVVLCSYP